VISEDGARDSLYLKCVNCADHDVSVCTFHTLQKQMGKGFKTFPTSACAVHAGFQRENFEVPMNSGFQIYLIL